VVHDNKDLISNLNDLSQNLFELINSNSFKDPTNW